METFVRNAVKIILETGIDVSGYSIKRILYVDPDGNHGYWDASAVPGYPTRIQRSMEPTDLTRNGPWRVQAYIAEGDAEFHGKYVTFNVLSELSS